MAGCPPPAVSYVGADGEQKEVQLFLGPAPGSFLMWSGDGVPQAELQVGEFEGCHYFSDITVAHAFQVACTGDKLYTFSVRDEGNCDAWVEAIQASAGASNGATANPLGPASTATPDDALPETWAEGFCDQPGKGCLYYCCPWKAFATIRDLDAHLKEEPVVLPGGLRQSLLDEPDGATPPDDREVRPPGIECCCIPASHACCLLCCGSAVIRDARRKMRSKHKLQTAGFPGCKGCASICRDGITGERQPSCEDDGSCGKPCATNCEDLCLADSCSGCALVQLEAQLAKHNADALADTPPPQGAASMDMQRELAPVGLAAEPSGAENRSGGHSICLSRWLGMIVCGMWVCLLLACELYIYWGEGATYDSSWWRIELRITILYCFPMIWLVFFFSLRCGSFCADRQQDINCGGVDRRCGGAWPRCCCADVRVMVVLFVLWQVQTWCDSCVVPTHGEVQEACVAPICDLGSVDGKASTWNDTRACSDNGIDNAPGTRMEDGERSLIISQWHSDYVADWRDFPLIQFGKCSHVAGVRNDPLNCRVNPIINVGCPAGCPYIYLNDHGREAEWASMGGSRDRCGNATWSQPPTCTATTSECVGYVPGDATRPSTTCPSNCRFVQAIKPRTCACSGEPRLLGLAGLFTYFLQPPGFCSWYTGEEACRLRSEDSFWYQYEYDADEDPSARLFPVGEPSRQQQQQQQQQQQSTGGLPVTWRFLDRWECGMAEYQGCNYDRGISGAFRCW